MAAIISAIVCFPWSDGSWVMTPWTYNRIYPSRDLRRLLGRGRFAKNRLP
jgi:hypothetical protein